MHDAAVSGFIDLDHCAFSAAINCSNPCGIDLANLEEMLGQPDDLGAVLDQDVARPSMPAMAQLVLFILGEAHKEGRRVGAITARRPRQGTGEHLAANFA